MLFARRCVVGLILVAALPVQAGNPVLVMDVQTGVLLKHASADQIWYPASLTKLMTLYLAFEALDQGRLTLAQSLPVSRHAAAQPAVRLGLKTGDSISAGQAMLALATVSSNDAAVVLAEALAGTETEFAKLMTTRAAMLDMSDTQYRNASGLPDDQQVTTARDQAILARRLLKDFPGRYDIFSTRSVQFRGRNLSTHNGLLARYPGADGMKTGFTCAAGYNMVASAVRDGRRMIAVVLGAQGRGDRDQQVRSLLDAGFAANADAGDLPLIWQRPEILTSVALRGAVGRTGCARGSSDNQQAKSVWPIESWGLLLGIYPDRAQARRAVAAAKKHLGGALKGGRPLLLERDMENGTSWKALLIGYKRDNVGAVCLQLRAKNIDCVAQPPFMLNLPGYAKR